MDNAKFCLAAQGWSTPECRGTYLLLRQFRLAKQEEDHAAAGDAMPLRAARFARSGGAFPINRLIVNSGKSGGPPRLGYGAATTGRECIMTDIFSSAARADQANGEVAMSRLADRLAAMAPPLNLSSAQIAQPARHSAAVSAALSTSAAIAKRADQRARRSRSVIGLMVDGFVATCSFIPYALVALAARLIMARVFFLDGQTRVDGIKLPINVQGFDFSFILPMQVKAETFGAFLTQYPTLPIPPAIGAYLLSGAEFLLPLCLVLGLATRFAAIGLLAITALIQIYVMPEALWSTHIYWAAMLTMLIAGGA